MKIHVVQANQTRPRCVQSSVHAQPVPEAGWASGSLFGARGLPLCPICRQLSGLVRLRAQLMAQTQL